MVLFGKAGEPLGRWNLVGRSEFQGCSQSHFLFTLCFLATDICDQQLRILPPCLPGHNGLKLSPSLKLLLVKYLLIAVREWIQPWERWRWLSQDKQMAALWCFPYNPHAETWSHIPLLPWLVFFFPISSWLLLGPYKTIFPLTEAGVINYKKRYLIVTRKNYFWAPISAQHSIAPLLRRRKLTVPPKCFCTEQSPFLLLAV